MRAPALPALVTSGLLSLFLLPPPLSGGILLADNFNDNCFSTLLWAPWSIGSGWVSEVNQRLEATAQTPKANTAVAGVTLIGDVLGDFDVQTSYTLPDGLPPLERQPLGGIIWDFGGFLG
jgi:hypothetical protein